MLPKTQVYCTDKVHARAHIDITDRHLQQLSKLSRRLEDALSVVSCCCCCCWSWAAALAAVLVLVLALPLAAVIALPAVKVVLNVVLMAEEVQWSLVAITDMSKSDRSYSYRPNVT